MTNAERARRFRTARTKLNPHGTETLAQVYAATGISASALSNLENPGNGRVPSAETVNVLAEYYQINAAWLTGQSESWSLNKDSQALTKVLGFTTRAADKLTKLMANIGYRNAINDLIESERFDRIIQSIAVLTDVPEINPEKSYRSNTVDYAAAVQNYSGNDSLLSFELAESDRQDLLIWRTEREMETLIRELVRRK